MSVNDPSGTYTGSSPTVTATVAGVGGTPGPNLEGVSLSLVYFGGTYTSTAQLAGVDPLADAPSGAGSYTILATFAGSTDYTSGTALVDYTIAQATPALGITDANGTYDLSAFPATVTAAGVDHTPGASLEGIRPSLAYYSGSYTSPSQLTGVTPLSAAPIGAGSYTIEASFAGSADYAADATLAGLTIAKAAPAVSVADAGGNYSGSSFAATAAVAGIGGAPESSLEGASLSLAYYSGTFTSPAQLDGVNPQPGVPSDAGSYTVLATFAGTADYATATRLASFTIGRAVPTIVLVAPDGTFDGSPFAASATIAGSGGGNSPAASLQDVSPVLTYYIGTGTAGTSLGSTPPTVPGTYTVVASFPGTADYVAIQSAPVTFSHRQGDPCLRRVDPVGRLGGLRAVGHLRRDGVGRRRRHAGRYDHLL